MSTLVVQKDDPEASFEPLLNPCGTQTAQKCTPRTKVKKINKNRSKTFEKIDRLDPIRLPRKGADCPLSLQTSLSIGSLPHCANSNHAESMLSVILKAMRNLAYRVGPKTPDLRSSGHGRLNLGSTCHAPKHRYLVGFCHIGTPEAPQEFDTGHLWSHHVSYNSI